MLLRPNDTDRQKFGRPHWFSSHISPLYENKLSQISAIFVILSIWEFFFNPPGIKKQILILFFRKRYMAGNAMWPAKFEEGGLVKSQACSS